jgi:hypothetical protein
MVAPVEALEGELAYQVAYVEFGRLAGLRVDRTRRVQVTGRQRPPTWGRLAARA